MISEDSHLFSNAFWVLKAGYHSGTTEINDLVEDAEFDEKHSQDLIQRSQQALVSPILRLDQELSWLPGLSERQISEIRALLEGGQASALHQAISFLPELPQANLLVHLCEGVPADAALVHSFLKCWEDLDRKDLLEFINSNRQSSDFPIVEAVHLETSLDALEAIHAKSLAMAIWRLDNPGMVLEQIVETELSNKRSSSVLSRLVREYDNLSEPKLALISDEISEQAELAREPSSDLDTVIPVIADLLRRWDDINQPVQVFEQYQGHEEGRSKKIYEKLRALCLELASERGEYEHAQQLSEALLETFPELESVAEVLKEDVEVLEGLNEQKKQFESIKPLIAACDAAKSDPRKLKSELRNKGFMHAAIASAQRKYLLRDIVQAFDKAVKATSDDAAFLVMRNLALFFNNEQDDPETAFRLIDGLLRHGSARPSTEVLNKLKKDRASAHSNWKMPELKRLSGNHAALLKLVEAMLVFAKDGERENFVRLKQLQNGIKKRQAQERIENTARLIVGGGLLLFVIWLVSSG